MTDSTTEDDKVLKTPDEWCKVKGIKVHDPDGWRGDWDQEIDEEEFNRRASMSTVEDVDGRLRSAPETAPGPTLAEEHPIPYTDTWPQELQTVCDRFAAEQSRRGPHINTVYFKEWMFRAFQAGYGLGRDHEANGDDVPTWALSCTIPFDQYDERVMAMDGHTLYYLYSFRLDEGCKRVGVLDSNGSPVNPALYGVSLVGRSLIVRSLQNFNGWTLAVVK